MKGIFLEFRVAKRRLAKVDQQWREIQHRKTQMRQPVAPYKWRRIPDNDGEEVHRRRMHLIDRESHFNFIKIHLLSHFSDHIRQFGNIPMYATEFGEPAHKEPIEEGWRRSNQNEARCQIVEGSSRQHAIRMMLCNIESLRCRGADLSADVLQHLESTTSPPTALVVCRRILEGR